MSKIPFLWIVIVIAGLAAATSACSASLQAAAADPAVYEQVELVAEKQAPADLQVSAPELAAPEAAAQDAAAQAAEGPDFKASQSDSAPLSAENSAAALQAPAVTEALPPAVQEVPAEQPTAVPTADTAPADTAVSAAAEPKVGFIAPDLTLTGLDGSSIRLADLRGKNVLINYWVTWCIPCMDELPILSRLSQDYQDQNVVILAVNGIEQDQLGDVQRLVTELGLTQPVLLDQGESFWSTYLVQFLPTSFFIDTNGVIRHIMLGSAPEDVIRSKIDELIVSQS